jgi:hypothetical protein
MRAHGVCRALGTFGAVGATALSAAACGSSSPKTAQVSTAALQRAAYVSAGASGYKVALDLHETVPSLGRIAITGNGTFTPRSHEGDVTMQMSIPGTAAASAGLSRLQMQIVLTPGTMYMQLPAALASKIPGDKSWLSFNLDQLGKAAGVPGLGSLVSSSSSFNDPGQYLDFLKAAADGSVQNLGSATVGGVQTTHYHAEVDVAKLPDAVPAAERAAIKQLTAELESKTKLRRMPVDAWIDSSHLVRRIELNFTESLPTGQSVTVELTENFLAYGPQPAPKIPPASQTTNLLALLKSAG